MGSPRAMGPPTFNLKHEAATFGQQAEFLNGVLNIQPRMSAERY